MPCGAWRAARGAGGGGSSGAPGQGASADAPGAGRVAASRRHLLRARYRARDPPGGRAGGSASACRLSGTTCTRGARVGLRRPHAAARSPADAARRHGPRPAVRGQTHQHRMSDAALVSGPPASRPRSGARRPRLTGPRRTASNENHDQQPRVASVSSRLIRKCAHRPAPSRPLRHAPTEPRPRFDGPGSAPGRMDIPAAPAGQPPCIISPKPSTSTSLRRRATA